MVKRTINCPTCGKDIVIKEEEGFSVGMAKKIWAEETKPDQVKELEKILGIKKTWAKKNILTNMEVTNNKVEKLSKKLKVILEDLDTTPYEKKVALFNMIKNLDVGDMPVEKKKRTNWLLQGHLYSELAKNCMKEYKKTTVESFSKAE